MASDTSPSNSQYPISQISPPTSSPSDDVASLPDSAPSDDIDDEEGEEEEEISDAEKQWQESLQQVELLLTMVVVPYAGKYFGRRFAYWGRFLYSMGLSCMCWVQAGLTKEHSMGAVYGMALSGCGGCVYE